MSRILSCIVAGLLALAAPALATPLVLAINNLPDDGAGSQVNAANLAEVLSFTGVTLTAGERVRITESIDLSQSPLYGAAYYQLVLDAPTIDLLGQVRVSGLQGNDDNSPGFSLNLNAETINLGDRVQAVFGNAVLGSGPGAPVAGAPGARTTSLVNVLSPQALLDQALQLIGSGGLTRVGAGDYAEAITAISMGALLLEQRARVSMSAGALAGLELLAGSVFDWRGGSINGGATDLLIGADAVAAVHGRDFALDGIALGAGTHQLSQRGGLLTGWLDDGSSIAVQIESRGRLDLFAEAAQVPEPASLPLLLASLLAALLPAAVRRAGR